MTKKSLNHQWDQLRQKYAAYLRLLEAIPSDRYHSHLVPGMCTPAELVVQMSACIVKDIAQGIAKGEIKTDASAEARIVADLGTKTAVIDYARRCWNLAEDAVATIGSAQLNAMVHTPWNTSVLGWVGFNILNDEFLNHYGQLYTYARLCGAAEEQPSFSGFTESVPQYRFAD